MALLGAGVLAIWNGMAPGADADFAAWHVREHMPERLGVPGFLRGRRYAAIDGEPAFFNFYETESPTVLTSPAYVARLNDPSSWSRRVLAQFRDTCRTVCDVAASLGSGEGGMVETVRLGTASDAATFARSVRDEVMLPLMEAPGITGVHLLRGRPEDSAGGTTEKALRNQPDAVADWILLVEAIGAEEVWAARQGAGSTSALARAGAAPGCQRGLYRLQFALNPNEGSTGPLRPGPPK